MYKRQAYGQESQVVLTTPILEGLDGVNKMSKSLGNAIGIHEPPLEMYGKVMSISDEMMWRYYELLTDVRMEQIAMMKADAASGKAHPMTLKKELARSIVADFHSAEAAAKAAEDWAKQFQKGGVPDNVEEVMVSFADVRWSPNDPEDRAVSPDGFVGFTPAGMGPVHLGVRLDRLLVRCGLADSVSDAARKLKAGSVRVLDLSVAGLEYVKPVSYTHLDVYKRQLQHGLKYRRALFDVRSHEDEKSDHHQPPVAHEHSYHHEHDGENVADAHGALRGVNHVSAPPKQGAQDAPAIQWIRRQQIEQSEVEVRPDDAPQQGAGVEKRSGGERKVWYRCEQDEGGQTGDQEIDHLSGDRDPYVALPGIDRVGNGVRFVEDGDAADGEQDDALRRKTRAASRQPVP